MCVISAIQFHQVILNFFLFFNSRNYKVKEGTTLELGCWRGLRRIWNGSILVPQLHFPFGSIPYFLAMNVDGNAKPHNLQPRFLGCLKVTRMREYALAPSSDQPFSNFCWLLPSLHAGAITLSTEIPNSNPVNNYLFFGPTKKLYATFINREIISYTMHMRNDILRCVYQYSHTQ